MLKNDIRFLGTSGSKKEGYSSSCVQVAHNIVIDAGNIIYGLGSEAKNIEHIFLTHSHLDHISDIAFLIDTYLVERESPLKIYGLKETLEALTENIFNWSIWPDFQEITLEKSEENSIEFIELELEHEYHFETVTLKPFAVEHTVPTCGFVIKKEEFSTIYATDTYITDKIWEEANRDLWIDSIVIDVSFPSSMKELAETSKHLTPMLLKEELTKLERDDISIYTTHIKPNYQKEVERELDILQILKNDGRVIKDGEYLKNNKLSKARQIREMEISTALSKEKDLNKILGLILEETMQVTGAEGGTIYIKEDDKLSFKAVKNDLLNIFEVDVNYPKIELYPNGVQNNENVSAVCAINKNTINIPDVYLYHIGTFNFEGTKKFDKANDYRSVSMLVVPMLNQDEEVVGVMQLINKNSLNKIVEFTDLDIEQTTTYANLCASAITKNKLIEDLEKLIISFLESISYALSVKSPYGYEHISRVKELMGYVAHEVNKDKIVYKDINYTNEEFQQLELAAWMHDIGKIATPEHILDKATRLETLYDQIHTIKMRFNYVKYFLKSEMLETKCKFLNGEYQIHMDQVEHKYAQTIEELESDFDFVSQANLAFKVMSDDNIARIKDIGEKSFMIDGNKVNLLTEEEINYLSIRRGTLSEKEREKINEHAKTTQDMLKMITFPAKYDRVAEIASGHHEKLNGKGYPLGLKDYEISFETRMLAVVDILEALTAKDRPYKKAKTEEETFEILDLMVQKGELDGKLVNFIKEAGIFKKYIQKEVFQEVTA
jgi:HD-GYP domain-containing protein (c-di-GMP phosphodiesterase class II)